MRDLAQRLKFVLKEKNLSQQWLADQVSVSQQSIGKVLKGETRNPKYIIEMANALGVNSQWLKTGEGSPDEGVVAVSVPVVDDSIVKIDVLDVRASAGSGLVPFDNAEVVKSIAFDADFFHQQFALKSSGGINLISVKGDSMQPTLNNNSLVFIDTNIQQFTHDGLYVFSFGDNLFIKRLQAVKDCLRVISDNDVYAPWDIEPCEFERLFIHGRVLRGLDMEWVEF